MCARVRVFFALVCGRIWLLVLCVTVFLFFWTGLLYSSESSMLWFGCVFIY
jgi:hypothetical protein